jgi:hypothetical protein
MALETPLRNKLPSEMAQDVKGATAMNIPYILAIFTTALIALAIGGMAERVRRKRVFYRLKGRR